MEERTTFPYREKDLEIRGQGDLGTGHPRANFKNRHIIRDLEILETARRKRILTDLNANAENRAYEIAKVTAIPYCRIVKVIWYLQIFKLYY